MGPCSVILYQSIADLGPGIRLTISYCTSKTLAPDKLTLMLQISLAPLAVAKQFYGIVPWPSSSNHKCQIRC